MLTAPGVILSVEGRLLHPDLFIMELMKRWECPQSTIPRLMYGIPLMKSWHSGHMTFARLTKQWTTFLLRKINLGFHTWIAPSTSRFPVHFCGQCWITFLTRTSEGRKLLVSTSKVSRVVGLRLRIRQRNSYKISGPCGQIINVSSAYLSHLAGL